MLIDAVLLLQRGSIGVLTGDVVESHLEVVTRENSIEDDTHEGSHGETAEGDLTNLDATSRTVLNTDGQPP